jgi:hypothetical protein
MTRVLLSKPDDHTLSNLIDFGHSPKLFTFFPIIALVNAYGVDPEDARRVVLPPISYGIVQIWPSVERFSLHLDFVSCWPRTPDIAQCFIFRYFATSIEYFEVAIDWLLNSE